MRFFLDNNVDATLASVLRAHGHEAWTAADARLGSAKDSEIAVYAKDKAAAVITHDREFAESIKARTICVLVRLDCRESRAAEVLSRHLADVVERCTREMASGRECVLVVHVENVEFFPGRW